MGDHIEGTSAIPTDTEASGWAELARLRQELDDMKKIIQALQTIIAENMQCEDKCVVEPLWKRSTEKGTKSPKMAKPAFFTGKMDEKEVFINSCTMYIVGQANDFLTDRAAIMWVLSYMQSGLALKWRDNYLEDMEKGVLKHTTLAQHSTEDAGVYLTHLVRAGWAEGLQTSVVAFDITQFFLSINHDVLLQVIDRSGCPPCVGKFFHSYLVGRCTTYKWNAFMSGPYPADVGVGRPLLCILYCCRCAWRRY
jgi:hypothetical protein